MVKFTKAEINLCRQIAEKHRKKVEYGDWFISYDNEMRLKTFFGKGYREEEDFPLWTIEDCLEFLRERGFRYDLEDYHVSPNDLIYLIMSGGKRNVDRLIFDGKTPLEALLKAVLAVLKGK